MEGRSSGLIWSTILTSEWRGWYKLQKKKHHEKLQSSHSASRLKF
jgi:hypothetical protein